MAVASGVLQRTAWCAGGARKTFHYAQPRCTPPCHIALAIGAQEGPMPPYAGIHASGVKCIPFESSPASRALGDQLAVTFSWKVQSYGLVY